LSIQTAALLAACFSLPGGVLRAVGGWFSDRYGAHAVTWWVLWLSWICLFLLSYPQTDFTDHDGQRPRSFHIGLNVYFFTALVFLLGIAWAFGKASVFKYISDEYPTNIGVISGVVGLAGGLGGFVLPIMFGALMDLTGIRSSAFMLMYGVVWVSLIWMYYTEVRGTRVMGAEHPSRVVKTAHATPLYIGALMQSTNPAAPVRTSSADVIDWRPEDDASGRAPARRSPTATSGSRCRHCSAALRSGACGASSPCRCSTSGFPFTQAELFTLTAIAGIAGATMRIPASFLIRLAGGRNTIFLTTAMLLAPAIGTGIALQHKDWPLWAFQLMALWSGVGGGNFASSMSNISTFFPKRLQGTALGLNAGLGNFGVTTMQIVIPLVMTVGLFGAFGWRADDAAEGQRLDLRQDPAGTPTWIQNAGFAWVLSLVRCRRCAGSA
jgi:NNP family nitrate/nitrite transporter-like MFS transporter